MKKLVSLAAVAAVAVVAAPAFAADESSQPVQAAADAAAAAPVSIRSGKMLYSSNGQRIASIYRVTEAGDPQVILNSKLITVPASTLSDVNGKITTSLTKADLGRTR